MAKHLITVAQTRARDVEVGDVIQAWWANGDTMWIEVEQVRTANRQTTFSFEQGKTWGRRENELVKIQVKHAL